MKNDNMIIKNYIFGDIHKLLVNKNIINLKLKCHLKKVLSIFIKKIK